MSVNTIVPLTNVGLLAAAVESAANRPPELPGLVVMYGPSGYGKSLAAAYAANLHRAYYVECRESWTKKAFVVAVLREMGIIPMKTLSEMVDQIAEQLSRSGRPLIVDDVQYVIDKAAANQDGALPALEKAGCPTSARRGSAGSGTRLARTLPAPQRFSRYRESNGCGRAVTRPQPTGRLNHGPRHPNQKEEV